MGNAERKVAEFIRRQGLFAGTRRILLAVSGGADSMALCHILEMLRAEGFIQAEFVCAHINHQLRGAASDADERFVVERAAGLRLPVVTAAIDVRAHAQTHGLSLETAGRQLRLAKLSEMARAEGCAWVAMGHQKNDNAETVVHRLWRGTGIRGLAGIWPVRRLSNDLWLARPLLCLTRDEIVPYLGKRNWRWREDRTNVDLAYTRNYIRHKLLPALQRQSRTSLIEDLSELAASARRLYGRIRQEAEEARSKLAEFREGEVALCASGVSSLPEPVAIELIRQALVILGSREDELTRYHYGGILRLARQRVGGRRISLPDGFAARREQDHVIVGAAEPATARRVGRTPPEPRIIQIPGNTRFAGYEIEARILERGDIDAAQIESDSTPFNEYLDLDRVKPPVVVRSRRAGDKFQPLGMPDEKKVGKFLTTAKLPPSERDRVLVFADREKVIWLCPVRISEQVKVTQSTQRLYHLKVTKPEQPDTAKEA